ncbi:hypothetical protein TYRP_003819 [Tyrophagus putrescentiae]|nr:hypothetical protein TYRP_003819 [Tyrophagus putrescentiae]
MKTFTLIFTCLVGSLCALPLNSITSNNSVSPAANTLIDALVTELNHQVHLDPLTLPKHVTNVSHHFVKLEIGGQNVQATSSVSAYFGPYIHPELRTRAEIGAVGSSLSVAVDYAEGQIGGQVTPILKAFEVDRLEKVHLHVQGPFLPFDPVIELIGDAFANIFNAQARHLLSAHVRPLVEEQLRGVHLNLTDTDTASATTPVSSSFAFSDH